MASALCEVSDNGIFDHLCHHFGRQFHDTAWHGAERGDDSDEPFVIVGVFDQFAVRKRNPESFVNLLQRSERFLQQGFVVFSSSQTPRISEKYRRKIVLSALAR